MQQDKRRQKSFLGKLNSVCLYSLSVLLVLPATVLHGNAQSMPSASQLQQLQQLKANGTSQPDTGVSPSTVTMKPDNPAAADASPSSAGQNSFPSPTERTFAPAIAAAPLPSPLETLMTERAGRKLEQFGYRELGVGRAVTITQSGAIQDDYVLGVGDEIVVSLRGQENNEFHAIVNRDGQLTLPRLNPISAAGRTFGSFRQDFQAAVHRAFVATEAFVTVGQVRQISVFVAGDVNNPGVRTVSGLASVLDALLLSGGVRKSGSLRNVHIERAGRQYIIDMYSALTGTGGTPGMRLANGDRIFVPGLGKTVAIAGVRRPGIYELRPATNSISATELLQLGQGTLVRGRYRQSLIQINPDGKQQFTDITDQPARMVRDGEILIVDSAVDQSVGRITLVGAVKIPGDFSLDKAPTLRNLLTSVDVFSSVSEPYMLFGLIQRIDTSRLRREIIPFSPLWVLQKKQNIALQSNDTVRILTLQEMRRLATPAPKKEETDSNSRTQEEQQRSGNAVEGTGNAVDNVPINRSNFSALTSGARPSFSGGAGIGASEVASGSSLAPGSITAVDGADAGLLGGFSPADIGFIGQEYRVDVAGAVHQPGAFLIMPGTTLAQVIDAAHGLDSDVDISTVEITSTMVDNQTGRSNTSRAVSNLSQAGLESVLLKPLDQVLFRHVFSDLTTGSVTVRGEVRYPGNYRLLRGEHLSSVIARAGGLTSVAYPYGTVFLRVSAAAAEKLGYERSARDMNEQLITATTRVGSDKITPDSLASLQAFVSEIRNQPALGRISVIADPSMLAAKPQLDPLMQGSDSVLIPQRPTTVAVLGQVMQQGNYPYQQNTGPDEYIARAGGFARFADDSNVFVVLPDGSARKYEKSWLNFDNVALPPGSTIVVPRDVTPFSWRQTVIDVSQIFSQFAVSIASLLVISRQ